MIKDNWEKNWAPLINLLIIPFWFLLLAGYVIFETSLNPSIFFKPSMTEKIIIVFFIGYPAMFTISLYAANEHIQSQLQKWLIWLPLIFVMVISLLLVYVLSSPKIS